MTGKVNIGVGAISVFFCPWNDRVPDGNREGKGRRKESEDEIRGRWGVLRERRREYFVGMVTESRDSVLS